MSGTVRSALRTAWRGVTALALVVGAAVGLTTVTSAPASAAVSVQSADSSSTRSSSSPWTCPAGCAGCSRLNDAATRSATFGLYFIVQEPSG